MDMFSISEKILISHTGLPCRLPPQISSAYC